jgi:hypothetical protein
MTTIIVLIILVVSLGVTLAWALSDPLQKFEPLTDDELLLLTCFDEDYYEDVIVYIRTYNISRRLQSYLATNKLALETLGYYISLKSTHDDVEKKKKFNITDISSQSRSDVDKKVMNSLNRLKKYY